MPNLPRPVIPVGPTPKHFDKYTGVLEITGGVPGALLATEGGDTLMTEGGSILMTQGARR